MSKKPLTLSIIIPAYNEEHQIAKCLDSVAAQTVKPLEIIVVDNNCTDATVAIAREYPGVSVVRETEQGLIPARDAGVRAASGDIIARLDADSRPRPQWLAEIAKIFQNPKVKAATGTGFFYDFPFPRFSRGFRNFFAVWLNRLFLGHHMLWGSNMAIRRNVWRHLSPDFCKQKNIMEDLDIAMHVADEYGPGSIVYSKKLAVDISIRRGTTGLAQNFFYIRMWPVTLRRHRKGWFLAWPAAYFLMATSSPFINTVTRFYDGRTNHWKLNRHQYRRKAGFKRDNP